MRQAAGLVKELKARAPIEILGVGVTPLTQWEYIEAIIEAAKEKHRIVISYANIHAVNLANAIPWFRELLNRSDIVFCDGVGLLLGVRILGSRLPERFTIPDWMPVLAERCCMEGLSIYFLGAQPGVAAEAAAALGRKYSGLRVAGADHGHFDHTPGSVESEAVLERVNASGADILLIAFGQPIQEQWLWQHHQRLNPTVLIPVGATFDYLAGTVRRGPRWMTDNGLEWLARLVFEPRRLWRRYVYGNPLFFLRVLQQRLAQQNRKRQT